ncbi:hypothetical protein EVB55_205 [Rhizobium phage RHph_Y68]|uniref:Uncharacterized protein n=1 Tax=Rhizobium phage RHph_Y68 TaxID=2509787 RepID=A0A7S5R541_9CAUD|nr:hypothetical protein PP934_gp205 [Rhizobium phage RHph_Y68]QIG68140.1 hypothetical protein EVB55_205 [Rhizobium phage RHph_Y68]
MAEIKMTREEYEALPTLSQLHGDGLRGRDTINRRWRSSREDNPKVFKKIVKKSEFSHIGKVVVTAIFDVVFTD